MQSRYEVEGNSFWIFDEELDIDLKGELEFLDKETFPTGEVRYETYRKEDKLHGPSYFYDKSGGLLSESWFYEGIPVGKVRRYYPNGDLYCIERYVEGAPHLTQEYFYLDGTIKTVIEYNHGTLNGKVLLYWPDGNLKRESHFENGERIRDQFFDEEGNEIFAASRSLS